MTAEPWMTRAILVAALVSTLGVAVWAARGAAPSTVIFPVQRLSLSFSHQQHLGLDVGCGYCHGAARSRRAADRNLPDEDTCATCHPIDRSQPEKAVAAGQPDARCASCHPGWNGAGTPPPVVIPTPNLKFNHELHAARGMKCIDCHGDLLAQGVGLATRAQLPRMASCLGCHDGATAPAACTTCHIGDRDGKVRTEYPEGQLLPSGALRGDAHDLRFRIDHARAAANDEKYCQNCHKREECLDCHDGVVKPIDFHAGDYVAMHGIDARRGTTDCGSCHRLQTFCTGCHARTGVNDDPKTSQFQRLSQDPSAINRFHPDGWWTGNDRNMRDARDHSFEAHARRLRCASCHREEFCKECHAQQINPHPASFGASQRCRSLLARAGRTCLRCHIDVADVRCR